MEVSEAKFLTILADETTDISSQFQFFILIFYVHKNLLKEQFFKFVNLVGLTGKDCSDTIFQCIHDFNLNIRNCVGERYYGCNTMSGNYKGVQEIIKGHALLAVYFHCANHTLNLAFQYACSIPDVRNAIEIIQQINNVFLLSAKRSDLLAKNMLKDSAIQASKLIPLFETRWVKRHDCILRFRELLIPVSNLLDEIAHDRDTDSKISSKAVTLNVAICTAKFICTILIMERVSFVILPNFANS